MISIIYQFDIKAKQTESFIAAWNDMTELIYEYENSLGSRLHKKDEHTYIAYAQWPNKETWKNSGQKLPPQAAEVRKRMKDACEKIEVLHELELVKDLLR